MTQEAVAGLVGHDKSWLSLIENGKRGISRDDIGRLADVLGVSPSDLTGEPYSDAPGPIGDPARDAVPAVRRALLDRPAGGRRSLEEIEYLVDELAALQQAGRAGEALAPAAVLLNAVRASTGGPDHREVSRLTVLGSYYVNSVLQAASRYDLALLATGLMQRAAAEAEDPVTSALAAVTTSYGLAQVPVGAYAAAVDEASAAADAIAAVGGVEAAAARGHLQLAAGFAAGVLREGTEASDRLAEAATVAGTVNGESTLFGRHLGFGPVNVDLHRVAVGVELGRHEEVVAASDGLSVERAPNPERAACWLADLGRSYAALERDSEAVDAFVAAEQIAALRTRFHPLVRESVGVMRDRPQRPAVGRRLRGLAYRMGLPH